MKKKKTVLTLLLLLIIACLMGCSENPKEESGTDHAKKTTKAGESHAPEDTMEENSENKLLSVDEFIRLSGISAEKYSDIDLQKFIEEYDITENVLSTLNIELLLEDYRTISKITDVGEVLDDPDTVRTVKFTDDVICIAFYENINTGVQSVYYDVQNNCRYKSDRGFVFDDLNSVEAEAYTDWETLLDSLEKEGVFSWKSAVKTDGIDDAQSMVLAFRYGDGSGFKVAATGILEDYYSAYSTVSSLLLE